MTGGGGFVAAAPVSTICIMIHLLGYCIRVGPMYVYLYSANKPSITQLIIEEADDNLFDKIKYNPSHPSTTSYQRKLITVTVFALDLIILNLHTLMIIGILLIKC